MSIVIDGKEYQLEEIRRKQHGYESEVYYKCPLCGKGQIIYSDDETPGFRDHGTIFDCKHCNPNGLVYTQIESCLAHPDYRKRTPEEVALAAVEQQKRMSDKDSPFRKFYTADEYREVSRQAFDHLERRIYLISKLDNKEEIMDEIDYLNDIEKDWYKHDGSEEVFEKLGITFNFSDLDECDWDWDDVYADVSLERYYDLAKLILEGFNNYADSDLNKCIELSVKMANNEWNEKEEKYNIDWKFIEVVKFEEDKLS